MATTSATVGTSSTPATIPTAETWATAATSATAARLATASTDVQTATGLVASVQVPQAPLALKRNPYFLCPPRQPHAPVPLPLRRPRSCTPLPVLHADPPCIMFRLSQEVKETRIRRESGSTIPKAGHIRVQKDINELDIPPSMNVSFPDPDDIMNFNVALSPEEGYYHTGTFHFSVSVPEDYPHKPPKVKCSTLVYHPNIDLDGNVCLNILRQDWKPVLSLSSILYGLQLLFLEPNPDDPLNKDAANLLKRDSHAFQRNVSISLRGGYLAGTYFPSARRR